MVGILTLLALLALRELAITACLRRAFIPVMNCPNGPPKYAIRVDWRIILSRALRII
jgi:hypothetical protein